MVVMRQDEDDAQYLSMDDEMTARFPLLAPNYSKAMEDDTLTKKGPYSGEGTLLNLLFWNLLHTVLGNSPLWTHAKSTTKSKNGRLVYFKNQEYEEYCPWCSWLSHRHRVQYIEAELDKCKYKGESGTWSLSKYCERMVNLLTQSDELVPLGYHWYDDKTPVAVDKFIAGIQHEAYLLTPL